MSNSQSSFKEKILHAYARTWEGTFHDREEAAVKRKIDLADPKQMRDGINEVLNFITNTAMAMTPKKWTAYKDSLQEYQEDDNISIFVFSEAAPPIKLKQGLFHLLDASTSNRLCFIIYLALENVWEEDSLLPSTMWDTIHNTRIHPGDL